MTILYWLLLLTSVVSGNSLLPRVTNSSSVCPGYKASNVKTSVSGLTADLYLAGAACNIYGSDLTSLTLSVTYQTEDRLHVLIQDAANSVYQVPASVFPRPGGTSNSQKSKLVFAYTSSPFSFQIKRAKTGEVLFDTSAALLIFESQYLRLRTKLPANPNLYGLGEHSDPFRLNTTDYTRTLWSADAYGTPADSNLYGNHPVYFEHRTTGSHGVFLLNSNGMDIKINNTAAEGQYLEYNTLGGVFDLSFFAGDSPIDVARQYAQVAKLPAMVPYWGFGYHNCRYGYQDAYDVAEAVLNYSRAGIPLETMWTDIDYMDRRRVFSLDPERYSLPMVQELVNYLHAHDQHYIVMVDPAVAYKEYPPFQRGVSDEIFLLRSNGSIWKGVVWPGTTAFPDWFHPDIQEYWNNEFATFFSPETGVDIDALWIDMNEPSNFPCNFPCNDPDAAAVGFPPEPPAVRTPPRPLPGFSCNYQPVGSACHSNKKREATPEVSGSTYTTISARKVATVEGRATGEQLGLPGRDLLFPKYAIHNRQAFTVEDNAGGGGISNHTVNTDVMHYNGLAMYDTHNIYGSMMSTASREAMIARRPTKRPLIITRSTFAGAGSKVGHWLGDNLSSWFHYRLAIRSMMAFASIYQIPVSGADVCGYGDSTTEQLCARWAMLGAFAPFYRNHNAYQPSISQEFYRWSSVTAAAKKAIDLRYRLLDYIYTAMYQQSVDGTPLINPMFYVYPKDSRTYSLENQYFYGPGLLVAPVLEENASSVSIYFPEGNYYSAWDYSLVSTKAQTLTITDLAWTDIPVYFLGGQIFPMRVESAMTTTALRKKDFDIVIAPDKNGNAAGSLYLDDGESLTQAATTLVDFHFSRGRFSLKARAIGGKKFAYHTAAKIATITILGMKTKPKGLSVDGQAKTVSYDAGVQAVVVTVGKELAADFEMTFK